MVQLASLAFYRLQGNVNVTGGIKGLQTANSLAYASTQVSNLSHGHGQEHKRVCEQASLNAVTFT